MSVGPSFGERGEDVSYVEVGINEHYVFLGVRLRCKVGRAGFERLTEGGLSSSVKQFFRQMAFRREISALEVNLLQVMCGTVLTKLDSFWSRLWG